MLYYLLHVAIIIGTTARIYKLFSHFVDFLNGENHTLTSETVIETSLLDKRPSLNRIVAGKLSHLLAVQ